MHSQKSASVLVQCGMLRCIAISLDHQPYNAKSKKGAPADVFISASPKQIDALQGEGLLYEDSRRVILSNRLVLVAPVNSPLAMTDAGDACPR